MNNKMAGDKGELDVVSLINCPNCNRKLMVLPKNYPLYDIQCTACSFRAQVKTNNSKPKNEIFGAGWDIMEKVLKSGFMVPPLIVNYFWEENASMRRAIYFYPFIPKANLKKRTLSSTAKRANYKMFNYVRLNEIPMIKLYRK